MFESSLSILSHYRKGIEPNSGAFFIIVNGSIGVSRNHLSRQCSITRSFSLRSMTQVSDSSRIRDGCVHFLIFSCVSCALACPSGLRFRIC